MSDAWEPGFLPPGLTATATSLLEGGVANTTWLVTLSDGTRLVVKGGGAVPRALFDEEAAGLAALRSAGLPTPRVIHVGPRSLALQALNPATPQHDGFWEELARLVALLHSHTGPRYGWEHDGWLGRLRQENAWDDDGHRFFAERRILRYLREPKARLAVDPADRSRLEKVCDRLPELVPASPAVLTHGDLWRSNIITSDAGQPVFIDPAVSWTWAEADISMMYCSPGAPPRFFDAYHEINPPLGDGQDWRARMELLHLRELLSTVAHFGPVGDHPREIARIVRQFSKK